MTENTYSPQEYVLTYLARFDHIPIITDTISQILKGEQNAAFIAALYSAYINKGMRLTIAGPTHGQLLDMAKRVLSNGEFLNQIKAEKFYTIPIADIDPDDWENIIGVAFVYMTPIRHEAKFVELNSRKSTKPFSFGPLKKNKDEKVSEVTKEEIGMEQGLQMKNVTALSNRISRLASEIVDLKYGRVELENEIKRLKIIIGGMGNTLVKMEKQLSDVMAGPSSQ